jgi:hypothetical protein
MDAFFIPSALGTESLEFYERTPTDRQRPLERFKVVVTDHDLSAEARVYAGHADTNPAPLFAQMAANWRGWQGEIAWDSMEGELSLRSAQDKTGHVTIRVALRSGPLPSNWTVNATIMAEAGQLEQLALDAELFFGRSG